MKNKKLKILYWLTTAIWMAVIFISSATSDFSSITVVQGGHNDLLSSVVHVMFFAVLCFLLTRSLILSGVSKKKSIVYAFLITIVYGALDEFHQYFVPGREVHFSDWLLDAVGALMVVNLYSYKIKK